MSFYLICISNKFVLNFRSNREAASKLMVFSFHSLPQAHAKLLYRRPLSHLSGCNRISNHHNSNGHIKYGEKQKQNKKDKTNWTKSVIECLNWFTVSGGKNYIHNESCCIQCGWAIECMYRKAFAISNEIKKYCSRASVFLFLPRLWNCNGECIALERMFWVVYWISIKWKSMEAGERLKGKDLGSTKIEIVFNSPFMVNCSYFTRWLLCNWNDDGTLSKMYWKMWENRRKKMSEQNQHTTSSHKASHERNILFLKDMTYKNCVCKCIQGDAQKIYTAKKKMLLEPFRIRNSVMKICQSVEHWTLCICRIFDRDIHFCTDATN